MITNFYEWLKKPLNSRYRSSSPLSIIICVTIGVIAQNIPFDRNSLGVKDIFSWACTVTVFLSVAWLTNKFNKNQ